MWKGPFSCDPWLKSEVRHQINIEVKKFSGQGWIKFSKNKNF